MSIQKHTKYYTFVQTHDLNVCIVFKASRRKACRVQPEENPVESFSTILAGNSNLVLLIDVWWQSLVDDTENEQRKALRCIPFWKK